MLLRRLSRNTSSAFDTPIKIQNLFQNLSVFGETFVLLFTYTESQSRSTEIRETSMDQVQGILLAFLLICTGEDHKNLAFHTLDSAGGGRGRRLSTKTMNLLAVRTL